MMFPVLIVWPLLNHGCYRGDSYYCCPIPSLTCWFVGLERGMIHPYGVRACEWVRSRVDPRKNLFWLFTVLVENCKPPCYIDHSANAWVVFSVTKHKFREVIAGWKLIEFRFRPCSTGSQGAEKGTRMRPLYLLCVYSFRSWTWPHLLVSLISDGRTSRRR
jgi:hypothetical protein